MNTKAILRRLAAVLALVLVLAVPAQAASFPAIVTSGSMPVYADQARTMKIGTLKACTVVDVLSYSDGVAKIELSGKTGFAAVSSMAALDSLAQPAVITSDTRVYRTNSTSSASMKVKAGMEVNLLATNGSWAMVENDGVVAYMNKKYVTTDLNQPTATPEPTAEPTPVPTEKPDDEVITETFSAEVTASRMRVYKKASASSTCLGSCKEGTVVTVHAYNRTWAYIELNGRTGYAKISDMRRIRETTPVATPTPVPTQAPTPEPTAALAGSYLNNEKYTIQERIHMFLTKEMGLNCAVACGILANIEKESSFKLTAASYDGGYGLIQWTGVRNTRLKNWCKDNGYDYSTLEGQMWYLKYELEKHHPKTLRHLRTIANTATGAYDAAYYFCYNFEVPANRAARSVERGNLAKSKYWPKYSV